jgi:IclR family transcriptional regulator, KDG regulon repressor
MRTGRSPEPLRYKAFHDLGRILSFFESVGGEERSISEIAKGLGMLHSRMSRMLKTLEFEGLVERNADTGKYGLGARFLQLGMLYVTNYPLRQIILPHLQQVARDLNVLVGWGSFKNDRVVVVDRLSFDKDSPTHLFGSNMPIHTSSYSKVFLAYLPGDERERILKSLKLIKFTKTTITDLNKMRKELETVKKQGYAMDDGETREDLLGLAAPILNGSGNIVAAMTISVRKSQMTDASLAKLVEYLTTKTSFISRQLGYGAEAYAVTTS